MKILFYFLLSMPFVIPQTARCQHKIEHRIVVGLNYSNVLIFNYGEQSYIINGGKSGPFFTPGFHAGYQIKRKVYKKIGLQTGLLYNQKGAKHYFNTPKLRIDYLTLPVLLRFKPVKKPFVIRAGFAWEFAVYANDSLIPVSRIQPLMDKTIIVGFEYEIYKNFGVSINLFETLNFYNSSNSEFGDKNQQYQLSIFKSF